MKPYFELCIPSGNKESEQRIIFGVATEQKEIHNLFKLRYDVYSERDYIDPTLYSNQEEHDSYDDNKETIHFSAITNGKTIACLRLIIDNPLPTEKAFSFSEPKALNDIGREQRGELGRFIIIPPDKERKQFLPRGIVMLFMLATVCRYAKEHTIKGGYSFVKKSLDAKLKKMHIPIHAITDFEQQYPKDGVLWRYFNQKNDPVIPMYYRTDECLEFVTSILNKKVLFQKNTPNSYRLRPSTYRLYRIYLGLLRLFK